MHAAAQVDALGALGALDVRHPFAALLHDAAHAHHKQFGTVRPAHHAIACATPLNARPAVTHSSSTPGTRGDTVRA